jgi:hypothetical protein
LEKRILIYHIITGLASKYLAFKTISGHHFIQNEYLAHSYLQASLMRQHPAVVPVTWVWNELFRRGAISKYDLDPCS